MNGRKPKLSPECAAKLREMYSQGETKRHLARLFRIDPRTVRNYLVVWHKHPEIRLDRALMG
jgi:hypothetical protein